MYHDKRKERIIPRSSLSSLSSLLLPSWPSSSLLPPSPAGSGITNSCNGGQTYCCMSLTPFFFLPSLALSVLPVPQLPSLVPASNPGTRCTLFSLQCRIWYLHPRSTTQSSCCSVNGNSFCIYFSYFFGRRFRFLQHVIASVQIRDGLMVLMDPAR